MSALIAFRISKITPISFSMAMNDYGFELLSSQEIPINQENLKKILSRENLIQDVLSSVNATEMARRKFRDIAVISGMVVQNYPGLQKNNKSLQASSGLIFNVLEDYNPENLLLKQAYTEVFNQQIDEHRLMEAFKRIENSKIILKFANAFTPLSFPIKVDSLRPVSYTHLDVYKRQIQNLTRFVSLIRWRKKFTNSEIPKIGKRNTNGTEFADN